MSLPTVHAPEIARDLTWLNTARPLSLRELRGQLVILDFWTYCCINCMHVVPTLRRIEERFANEPVIVVGVHSAKFDEEKDAARIEEAMRRYDVQHPVVVDQEMRTWSAFAVRSWPTLVVVRPDGTLAAIAPGEPDPDALERFVEDELARARAKGTLAAAKFPVHAPAPRGDGVLACPGKVAIGPDGAIAIADSGHHRVLVVDGEGRVRYTAGSGLAGHADGALDAAAFDDPQGLAWRGATEIFVADARTHTVRRIDLARGEVSTVAGTGALGEAPLVGTHPAREVALRSPWDLALDGDRLVVALAGSHQLAVVDLAQGTVALLAGTGAESMIDGPLVEATFSQPSGLALDGTSLYVADSETSAVRLVDLARGEVRTLVGAGLFDFGDVDGAPAVARMQHCIGIALGEAGALVVADTYNHKLRTLDRTTHALGTLHAGALAEPAGLAWDAAHGAWLVADTNHHRIARIDREGRFVGELAIQGAPAPARGRIERRDATQAARETAWFTTQLAAEGGAALAPGDAHIALTITAPDGKKLASGAPLVVALDVSRRSDLLVPRATEVRLTSHGEARLGVRFDATIAPLPAEAVEAEVILRIDAIVCPLDADAEGAVCEPYRAWLRLPVRLARGGGPNVTFIEADA